MPKMQFYMGVKRARYEHVFPVNFGLPCNWLINFLGGGSSPANPGRAETLHMHLCAPPSHKFNYANRDHSPKPQSPTQICICLGLGGLFVTSVVVFNSLANPLHTVVPTTKIMNYYFALGQKETNAQSLITHKFCGCFVNETTRGTTIALFTIYISRSLRKLFLFVCQHKNTLVNTLRSVEIMLKL